MLLNVIQTLLFVVEFRVFAEIVVVVTEVSSVHNVVFNRQVVVCHGFNVMWADKPLSRVFCWHLLLNHLQVLLRWQVQLVTRCHVVISQLITVLNHAELLDWVKILFGRRVDEVLLVHVFFILLALSFFRFYLLSLLFLFFFLLFSHEAFLLLQILKACSSTTKFEIFDLSCEMFIDDVCPPLWVISKAIFMLSAVEVWRM